MHPERQVREDGYLTLDTVPDENSRRAFLIPTDPLWFGTFMGAIAPLLVADAWRKYGALTPEECADVWQEIFFSSPPCGCELPGGGKVIRINPVTGKLEELSDETGDWIPPTGDYAVPEIPPREGTEQDVRCLAAANAVNVLSILYESITDSIAAELEVAEALTAMIEAFITAVGWAFAPIAFAIAAFFLAVFGIVYGLIKTFAPDLWDETFSDVLQCALYTCASVDGEGVVTFDWTCAMDSLTSTPVALTADQLRLYGQLAFIVQMIGGADGLNVAGGTTAITSATCDCGDECGLLVTFIEGDPFTIIPYGYGVTWGDGTVDSGFGDPEPSILSAFGTDGVSPGFGLAVEIDLGASISVDGINLRYWYYRDDTIDALYCQIDLLDSGHGLINNAVPEIIGGQGEWQGLISPVAASGVRYVQIRLAGSGDGMTVGDCNLDNVCITPP